MDELCDFTDNCGDSTDEEYCGEFTMTNFEVLHNDDNAAAADDDINGDNDDEIADNSNCGDGTDKETVASTQ